MEDVARFWIEDVGVDGFRLDGAKHLIEDGNIQENSDATHEWWKGFRAFLKEVDSEALMLGEIWSRIPDLAAYTQGDEFDLVFNFDFTPAPLKDTFSIISHT